MSNSGKKLALNTVTSFFLQIVITVSGFILPRLILNTYGSDVNGLLNSITQFLGIVSLLDLGVGAVVQSSFYKPLADGDINTISKIYVSASRFFRVIAVILLAYAAVLTTVYPVIAGKKFGYLYTASLILAVSISSFAQYYFGAVNGLLLSAHQKIYIQNTVQTAAVILNTVLCTVLIKLGSSVQLVKLTTSLIYLTRPLCLYFYVERHYKIDKKIKFTDDPVKQKWNGMAQHFVSYLFVGTDNIVLTLFSTLENVSIYSVYNIVIRGTINIITSMTNGFKPLMGEMLAKNERGDIKKVFGYIEWLIHKGTVLILGCTGILIVPFIRVYTNGITDADYVQPLFAALITAANAVYCLRLPYNILILAAGHYKQTQSNYITAIIINIAISVAAVRVWGLVGTAMGTLAAMTYQTVWMAWYDSKNIICWEFKNFLKQTGTDILTVLTAFALTFRIPMADVSYRAWVVQALEVFAIWCGVTAAVNLLFYRSMTAFLFSKIRERFLYKYK